jgi:hypothetical protein
VVAIGDASFGDGALGGPGGGGGAGGGGARSGDIGPAQGTVSAAGQRAHRFAFTVLRRDVDIAGPRTTEGLVGGSGGRRVPPGEAFGEPIAFLGGERLADATGELAGLVGPLPALGGFATTLAELPQPGAR